MTRDNIIEGYMMNSQKVLAEMLYDTIERYENRTCEKCVYLNKDTKVTTYWCSNVNSSVEWINGENTENKAYKTFGCNKWKEIE